MPQRIAVLTGDVIDSRKVEDRSRLYRLLDDSLAELASRHGGHGERFRGDGFQLALPQAAPAMEAAVDPAGGADRALRSRPALGCPDCRAAGPAERGIAAADGATFVASGRALMPWPMASPISR